jgi:hypothetical protein
LFYLLNHALSPFCVGYFWDRVLLHACCSSHLCFLMLAWDDRCTPSHWLRWGLLNFFPDLEPRSRITGVNHCLLHPTPPQIFEGSAPFSFSFFAFLGGVGVDVVVWIQGLVHLLGMHCTLEWALFALVIFDIGSCALGQASLEAL